MNENKLQPSLIENIKQVKMKLGNSSDLVIRELLIGVLSRIHVGLIYMDGITDAPSIQNFIKESLLSYIPNVTDKELSSFQDLLKAFKERVLAVGDIHDIQDVQSLISSLLAGDVILLIDGQAQGIAIGMRGGKDRGVVESTTESVIRGPKEAFTESIRTNASLIRRKIKDGRLWMETKTIGRITHTEIGVMYIKGVVNEKALEEVHLRLDRIDIDGILESGYIEELIQDKTYTPFPTIFYSERPDVIAAELLEGKIAILVDGTPNVLIVPALFISFTQAAEDYYQRSDISTLIRVIRYVSMLIALLAPSIYIAVTTFHQEMLPTQLLISLAAQREGVPFPAFIEALLMEVAFEVLREASLRMPKAIAQAISIVGTLVIGTAAVEAGIVSAVMVIVVSITAISSFVLPAFPMSMSFRILRFPMMALAASFGLFGIILGFIALVLHLCSLRSFGVPYMSPFAPFIREDMKDTILRVPWWRMLSRPRLISQNYIRENRNSSVADPRQNDSGG